MRANLCYVWYNKNKEDVMNILFLLSSLAYSYSRTDFKHRYIWDTKPRVVLCDDAKVEKADIERAMAFWKDQMFGMHEKIISKPCKKTHRKGEIRITGQRDLDTNKYYAFTLRDISPMEISAATILIEDAQADNLELIIHELGHALGLNHSDDHDVSHIMHRHVVDNPTRLN